MHGWNEIGLEIKIQSIIYWGGNNFLHSGQWPKTKTKRNREREREREREGGFKPQMDHSTETQLQGLILW